MFTFFEYIAFVFVIAFVFFGLIPGIGAFIVRSHWRRFRKRLIELSLQPFISYSDIRGGKDGPVGEFRFFGTIEALQGDNMLWIKNGNLTVAAYMKDVVVYMLPSTSIFSGESLIENLQEVLPDEEPKSMHWNEIFSLSEGTRVFVGGMVYREGGNGIFRSQPEKKLLFVIYDGEMETILKRAIWAGRQRNEYFNQFTFGSILAGSLSLLFLSYLMLHNPMLRVPALFAITLASFPVASLVPPGVLFYFLYRWTWKQGRVLRAKRDLLRLPLRYFSNGIGEGTERDSEMVESSEALKNPRIKKAVLPTGEGYCGICGLASGASLLSLYNSLAVSSPDVSSIEGTPVFREGAVNMKSLPGELYMCLFGALVKRKLKRPVDPMAEMVAIPGNPEREARKCQSMARIYELLSAIFIFSDLVINMFLILLFLHRFIV